MKLLTKLALILGFKSASAGDTKPKRSILPSKEQMDMYVKNFNDMPEPKCSKCGRIIYCGVNTLCKDKECGLK